MATIKSAIQIYDGMSPALRSMTNAMNIALSSFESLQNASSNAIDTASIQAARGELNKAEIAFNQIEQEIRQADQQQQKLNTDIQKGTSEANGLLTKLGAIAATYLSFQTAGSIISLSDELTNTTARLNMINDGLQTTAELQEMIFQAAQRSRGSYSQTADLAAKLAMNAADAFSSNAETIHFAELLNKQYVIAGTNVEGIQSATLQLMQALGSGVLRGEELNAVFEAAPNIIRTISDYLGVGIGEIRNMASEGEITADIVKKAMFAATDAINKDFESMPYTFSQIWTSFKNEALKAFQPVLKRMNDVANNDKFQSLINRTVSALYILSIVVLEVFNFMAAVGNLVYDNWSILGPIIMGVGGALLAYSTYLGYVLIATKLVTAAQWAWSAAMSANPIGLIIAAIVLLISLFYAAINAINRVSGTAYNATGMIAGAFLALLAIIGNIFVAAYNLIIDGIALIWNGFAGLAEFLANVFVDPVGSIVRLFANMADSIYAIMEGIASVMDTLFGSNLASVVSGWRSNMQGKVTELVGEAQIKMTRMDASQFHFDRFGYGNAWEVGHNWGTGIEDKIRSFKMDDVLGNADLLDKIGIAGADTAANTAKMADSMEVSEEDLKYLRDLAEQEVVNRYTTAEIKVDMNNTNHINSNMDLDGVVSYLEDVVYETMSIAAEGVHD